ncbi:MAG: ferrous iron transport protein B [Bacteroidales bacterium]|nr:ferrous iron transport protein B [Bacteroidales bacterium]MCM1147399.1 ferrous iron transport protein B [Bacteroidales bacterium]MCM1206068.1 ferrous iron transport protein B [Bacillota bacterium]MCM1510101.1 ferrous iron transport protein B [Clostridium sp.]
MKLSELHTGEKAIIVKVLGHGGFRKRIVEMGFITGKEVTVLLNAPLQDPVKYLIMGYEVSMRRDEAEMIEVVSLHEVQDVNDRQEVQGIPLDCDEGKAMHQIAQKKRRHIDVALVGNPNCGKTSLFNYVSGAHERVGNYSGVTVDAKEGIAYFEDYEFHIVDLPGTYSLSAYSPEELYVRKQIVNHTPDVILNVLDASNLERNLYLTTQLIDMHLRMVCALNMFDETEKRGDRIDHEKLGSLLAVPMVPTVFKNGRGVQELFHTIIGLYEGKIKEGHIHVNHGVYIEKAIDETRRLLRTDENLKRRYSTRFVAIKLLEGDSQIEEYVRTLPDADAIFATRDMAAKGIETELKTDAETAVMDAKYGFVNGALQEAEYGIGAKQDTYEVTHLIDHVITHRYLGFPLFFAVIFLMFEVTFTIGQYPADWIEAAVSWFGNHVSTYMPDGPVKDMTVDGIIGGVGSVIVFLPQILILYTFISFMEDSGYMARAAFIMDKPMHKMGLHGKSFIPLIMGFGCNVPALMATRTIESRRSRLITMLIMPFVSCSARLPIYIMITGAFFAAEYRVPVLIGIYATGILVAATASRILSRFLVKGEDTPFVMELPPYRFPTAKAILRHTWEKGRQYLKKMGGIILIASILVWALGYFPRTPEGTPLQEQQEQSYIGRIGKAIEPVFRAQGFNWKLDVGLVAGIGAKEIVASTIGVLYSGDSPSADDEATAAEDTKYGLLRQKMEAEGITTLNAVAFLVFVLLYFPCTAAIIAIKNESGSWRWAAFAAMYTTAVAWTVSAIVYQTGLLLLG